MASLPIPAEAELDQIFGGSDDEDDNMLFPMTRTATASDLLDEEFPTSSDDKDGTSLLMDVLVQRTTSTEEEHAEEDREKTEGAGQRKLSSSKSEREREGKDGSSKDRRYGLRDRRTTRKRPPEDAAVFGDDHPPRKAVKESKLEQTVAPESGEEGDGEGEEEEEEEDSDSDAVYCICRQPHDGRFMICCDHCEEWYHGSCVGISVAQGKRMEKESVDYVCPTCRDKEKQQKMLMNKEIKEKRADSRDQLKQKNVPQASPKPKLAPQKDIKSPTSLKSPERRKSLLDSKEDKRPTLKSPTKKLKDVNGKQRLDKLAEDRRRFLMGDAAPDRGAMKECTVTACSNLVIPPTLYCSDTCVERYAAEAINTLLEYGVSFHGGINVIDTATGKVIMYATSRTNLVPFLKQHRSYMVHLPSGPNPMKRQAGRGSTSEGQVEEERKGERSAGVKVEDEVDQKDSVAGKTASNVALPSKAPRNPEELRQQAKKALYFTLLKRVQESDDLKDTDKGQLEEMGAEIEESLFAVHKDVNHRYKARYRQLLFNLKDEKNEVLFRKVVHKEIKTSQLVLMSHDQLASEELSKWREEELKKNIEAIKERESKVHVEPIRKITKKGEEEIEQGYESTPVEGDLPKQLPVLEAQTPGDATSEHGKHLFDANCDICQGKVVRAPEAQEAVEEGGEREVELQRSNPPSPPAEVATASPVGVTENWSPSSLEVGDTAPSVKQEEVRSPEPAPPSANKEDLRAMARKQLTRILQARAKVVDGLTDVDSATWQDIAEGAEQALFARFRELDAQYKNQYRVILSGLKERGNGYLLRKIAQGDVKAGQLAMMSREELEPPLWVGHIHQQGLTKFLARAHRVSGNCARLPEAMPELLNVVGRISFRDVWSYLEKVKQTPTKTVAVLRFEWLGEDRGPYMSLLDYLVGRQRIGVIDVRGTNLKDFYVVPLLSGEELPKAVRDLRGPGLGSANSGDQLLGVVVRTEAHHGQPPPPPPPPRRPHAHRSHWQNQQQHKGEVSKPPKSSVSRKDKFVIEVGIGDRTPPLPGEAGLTNVRTPGTGVPSASPKDAEVHAKPVITLYRSAEAPELASTSGTVGEGVGASGNDRQETKSAGDPMVEGSRGEDECIISESSLSPPSSLDEDGDSKEKDITAAASDDEMEVEAVTAYSPSAPLEDEPYSPSHNAPLEEEEEEKMDATSKEDAALELPYSPETAAVEDVEEDTSTAQEAGEAGGITDTTRNQQQKQGAFSLLSSLISSKAPPSGGHLQDTPQPSQSLDTVRSTSEQEAATQNSSVEQSGASSANLSSAQLQNLLAKLPILAKSILGQSATPPPHSSAPPSSQAVSTVLQATDTTSTSLQAAQLSSIPVLGSSNITPRLHPPPTGEPPLYDAQGPPHVQFPGLSDGKEGAWHSQIWRQGDPRQQRQGQEGWQ